jgi:hypothetical protein
MLTGTIFDVSPSGISVESDGSMALHQAVNIVGEGFTGEGIVRKISRPIPHLELI